jgi:hypothetical protein
VGVAKLLAGDLRQPEVAHLPGGDHVRHRPDGLGDRHARIALVQVPEVDDLDASISTVIRYGCVAYGAERYASVAKRATRFGKEWADG